MDSSSSNIRPSEEQSNGPGEFRGSSPRQFYPENPSRPISIGAVIPSVKSRLDNLEKVLNSLVGIIDEIVVVCDGWNFDGIFLPKLDVQFIEIPKHEPGKEQPRNIGVRYLDDCNYIWFLDSDCVIGEGAYLAYVDAIDRFPEADIFFSSYNPNGGGAG